MALIKLNRTKTGVVPTTLADGELYVDQLNGRLYWADATGVVQRTDLQSIPSGTKMIFRQSSAPTGWTKDTSVNDAALRVVSGAAGNGGSIAFSTAFASGVNTGDTVLTTAQMPAHSHTATVTDPGHTHTYTLLQKTIMSSYFAGQAGYSGVDQMPNTGSAQTGISVSNANTGGGAGHNHSTPSANLKYVDVIVATKD